VRLRCAGFTLALPPTQCLSSAAEGPAAQVRIGRKVIARPRRLRQAEAVANRSNPIAAHFGSRGPKKLRRPLQNFPHFPHSRHWRRWAERPGNPRVLGCQNRRFVFCRFCHFRVLTPKRVSHITRLADADGLAARRQRFLIGQICCRGTGSKILFPKIRKHRFHDAALERGSQGPLFDIVKMEERETWTARFLRSDREIGQTDFDGTFF